MYFVTLFLLNASIYYLNLGKGMFSRTAPNIFLYWIVKVDFGERIRIGMEWNFAVKKGKTGRNEVLDMR